jgi:hypothetical protein
MELVMSCADRHHLLTRGKKVHVQLVQLWSA